VLIPREGQVREDLKNLTWININDTNDSVLEWLEHNFNVCAEDIKRELASEENPSGCRYSNYLILKFDELADGIPSLSLNGRGLAHNRCVMVCADNFIITLSDNPLRSVSRVWSEVVNQQGCQDQPRSSNAVATRIIGSNLHINQGAVSILAEGVRSFIDKKNSKLPKSADLRWLRNMSAKLNACESALESMHDLIDRLEEQRNLFGEPKACDELDRYQRAVNLADGRIEHARRDLKDLGDSWRAADAKWQADVVYRLALITGLCTPISVVSSVFGSNFATMPPDSWMWAALCGAVVVSTTLVGALLYKKRAAERWE
jgi:Mg2+ and Co2+ transporter CorA